MIEENKSLFKKIIIIFATLTAVSLIWFTTTGSPYNLQKYAENKDNFDYNVDLNYKDIKKDNILIGETIYNAENNNLTTPADLLKKLNRLASNDAKLSLPTIEYDYIYDGKDKRKPTMYNVIKSKHIDNYINANLKDKKYQIVTQTFDISTNDKESYIKDFVFFIDGCTVEKCLVIDNKINVTKNKLEYSKARELNSSETSIINDKLNSIYNSYMDCVARFKNVKTSKDVSKVYIKDVSNCLVKYVDDSLEEIEY